jgi:spore coat protein CotH
LAGRPDWDQLRAHYTENTFYPCDVEWRGVTVINAGCRSRGAASRSGTKPGLLIDFSHYVSGQEFLGLPSLVLDNLWQDPSMMKERLSMLLFQHMGLRLYVGGRGEFAGLYAIVEDVAGPLLTREFGSEAGYLYEYRWKDEYHFEDLGPNLDLYAERFEPRTRKQESLFALYAPLRDMVAAIVDAAPARLEEALAPHLDVEALLAYVAVEHFLSEWDGITGYAGMNNFYLYRVAEGSPFRPIAWDKDFTFQWVDMPPWYNLETNVLTNKAWADPHFRALYLGKLLESAEWDEWLATEASREYAQIREATLEDPLKPFSNTEFEQAAEDLTRFLQQRGAIVRRFVAQLSR